MTEHNGCIIPLHGTAVGNGQPVEGVIAILERFLVEARRGEIDGLAIAISRPNDEIETDFRFGGASYRIVAAASFLHHRLLREIESVTKSRSVP